MTELIQPPFDPLRDVFTRDVFDRWISGRQLSNSVHTRLRILCACGPRPSDPERALEALELRAWKAAWETYLFTAFACGTFEGERGKDLRARLTSIEDDDFRAALAECMTCWFLAGRMKFSVDSIAGGRPGKILDFHLQSQHCRAGIEVKAPFRERVNQTWSGNDSDKIAQCIVQANKQFDKDAANILVIAPALRTQLFSNRSDILRAAYGHSIIKILVNKSTGEGGPPRTEFCPAGKLLNPNRRGGRPLKADGLPAHRRISAILCIEETVRAKYQDPAPLLLAIAISGEPRGELMDLLHRAWEAHRSPENEMWVDHQAMVLHNPHAYHPIPEVMWTGLPQFVARDDWMVWTDGYSRPV